jgi:S1-C subfamily serine protease
VVLGVVIAATLLAMPASLRAEGRSGAHAEMASQRGAVGFGLTVMSPEMDIVIVLADSPAAKAGIQVGDVLVALNGEPTHAPVDYPTVLRLPQRAATELTLRRRNARDLLTVTLVDPASVDSSDPPGR